MPLFFLLGLLILALVVGGVLLQRGVRRGAAAAGDRAGRRFIASRLQAALGELGTPLVIHADEAQVRAILAEAILTPRQEYRLLDSGDYGIRFGEKDDTVVRLHPDPAGTRMQVESFREYLGFPQTVALWTALRARVAATAATRGVTVGDGEATTFTRGPLLDDRNARWIRDD